MKSVHQAVEWGYSFIKHDFSTYELFGRWGSEMHAQVTGPGWHFSRQIAHEYRMRGDRP